MTTDFVANLRGFFSRLFPERQIYHRSRGEVHFITVSARYQIILIAGTLGFLTWVAFTTVNVVFKDQIIANKDQNFSTMQTRYETRVDRLQREIDNVNGSMRVTQDGFARELDLLRERQEQLDQIVGDEEALNVQHDQLRQVTAIMGDDPMHEDADGTSTVHMAVAYREPTLRVSRPLPPVRSSTVDGISAILATAAQAGEVTRSPLTNRANRIAQLEDEVRQLRTNQRDILLTVESAIVERATRYSSILESTGLDVDAYITALLSDEFSGMGGPSVDLDALETYAAIDEDTADFSRHLLRTANHMDQLAVLQAALNNLPLVRPSDIYRLSSEFGMRRDPFTRRLQMHSGLDFAGPSGTPVMATAAGVVTRAGSQGGYGRIVVIDHGNGIETRYGHLRRVNVEVGEEVTVRQVVGQLGSTGRSTGPHVHYEVRFQGQPLDPLPFLEAGRHVFES